MEEAIKIKLERMDSTLQDMRVSVAQIEERTRTQGKQGGPWAQEQIRSLNQRVAALEHLTTSVDAINAQLGKLIETEQKRQGSIKVLGWIAGIAFGGGAAGIISLLKVLS